ncbi:DUF1648 domain-containing protein [Streptomyces zingiberis]|uniref:DUF1648 domain-containing protein n=1 Tax=Streptomyces zingiberis TaxID=2053010 RepID=UPI0028934166|nr:DUF1648 domain-containing protein [Streptomyces zingiberis]
MATRTSDETRPAFPWLWLLPGGAVLLALTVWGIVAYPGLPGRVPLHFAGGGVDRWGEKSVGTVFLPVFVHAGLLALMAVSAVITLRTRPETEVPGTPSRLRRVGGMNRPASRASALRLAKVLLFLAFCLGLTFAAACAIMWRPETWSGVPAWPLWAGVATTAPVAAAVLVITIRDRREAAALRAERRAEGESGDEGTGRGEARRGGKPAKGARRTGTPAPVTPRGAGSPQGGAG